MKEESFKSILVLLATWVVAMTFDPFYAVAETTATATPAATVTPAVKAEGKTIEKSDYVAKYFWLATGSVILDPFKLEDCTDKPELCDKDTGKKRFRLKSGDTTANVFVEGGYRRRWAWLDRLSTAQETAEKVAASESSDRKAQREAAEARLTAAQKRIEAAKLEQALMLQLEAELDRAKEALETAQKEAAAAKTSAEKDTTDARVKAAAEQLKAVGKRLVEKQGDAAARPFEAELRAAKEELSIAEEDVAAAKARTQLTSDSEKEKTHKELEQIKGDRKYLKVIWANKHIFGQHVLSIWQDEGLPPLDFDMRGGFVFSSGTSGAAGIVGGSDFYVAAAPALNLARWYWQGSAKETPTRGTLSLELSGALSTDRNLTDTHGRYFLGLSTALGVPWDAPIAAADSKDNSSTDSKDKGSAQPAAAKIIELLLRVGAANVETPTFLDNGTRQVAVQNEVAAFRSHWGLGVDLELNVPITEKLGYLMVRGQVNTGFNPNPWALQLGYTIPLSSLLGTVTGGS